MKRALSVAVLLLSLVVVLSVLRPRPGNVSAPETTASPGSEPERTTSGQAAPGEAASGEPTVVLESNACADVAYLCAGILEREQPRVLRWADATPAVTVRIPLPPDPAPSRARELQRAAARGVRAWQGHPFAIRMQLLDEPAAPDIRIRWSARLPETELGHVELRWTRRGERASVTVTDFVLATRDPINGQQLSASQVTLAAAHEMGHALGLPHSDSPRDVMYPTNTASRPSADDYRAMEALYRLPNGAYLGGPGS